jgi:hypothetical protein
VPVVEEAMRTKFVNMDRMGAIENIPGAGVGVDMMEESVEQPWEVQRTS